MNKKCSDCGFIDFSNEEICRRCRKPFGAASVSTQSSPEELSRKLDRAAIWFLKRFVSGLVISLIILCGVYFSLLQSAEPLSAEQAAMVERSIKHLEQRGFSREVFLLRRTVAFRASDNWLNSATRMENAYAATNFPFQIVTLYDSFFTRPVDDIERAMVLLHEAQHLQGGGEPEAYEFVWRHRKTLGWTEIPYGRTVVWQTVFEATRQNAPDLFRCSFNENADCTF
jgi:hypothetical protein